MGEIMKQDIQRNQGDFAIWAERVEACRNSGMSVKQWCVENGIALNTYYRWQKKIHDATCVNQNEFYEVSELRTSAAEAAANIEINGLSASIYRGADEETIRALLSAMKLC